MSANKQLQKKLIISAKWKILLITQHFTPR